MLKNNNNENEIKKVAIDISFATFLAGVEGLEPSQAVLETLYGGS